MVNNTREDNMEKVLGGIFALLLLWVGINEIPGMNPLPSTQAILIIFSASVYLVKTAFFKK